MAGSGGRGAVSFRREKYVPAGGPDGGDGGRGGDVVLVADSDDMALTAFRDRRRFAAGNGRPGEGGRRSGHDGATLSLQVPPGTVVRSGEELVADLDRRGAQVVVARGGRGGRGNARFATPTRQAPRAAELGERGERRRLHLELRLIADVGLVGLPNAGKSTLLAALTGARPRIGDYPFTTLHPNLGVADVDGRRLTLADVPGLIEGAHRGAGLGLGFLRHVDRTRVTVHVVDAAQGVDAARNAVATVRNELRAFSPALAERPEVLALNKVDIPGGAAAAAQLQREWPAAVAISAAAATGLDELLRAVLDLVPEEMAPQPAPADGGEHRVYRHAPRRAAPLVTREGDAYRVSGESVERMVQRTDMDSDEAVAVLQARLRRSGVDAALASAGCRTGDTVRIGDVEFTYSDDERGR